MKKSLIWRSVVIILAVCISAYFVFTKSINKGIDVAGGTHFKIEVLLNDIPEEKKAEAMESAMTVYRNRIDEIGVSGTTVAQAGQNQIVVQVPGIETEEANRIKEILLKQAHLEFKLVVDGPGEPITVN